MGMSVTLKPIETKVLKLTIVGTSKMVQHKWSEKALRMIRERKMGKKTREREVCDPQKEAEAATHRTADGRYGIPVSAVKSCIINAAHKDLGIDKTLVRKSFFILCKDPDGVLPMKCKEPKLREDSVRVGMGASDLRYRPEFQEGWECDLEIQYDTSNLQPADLVNLINRAGFGVGLLEWRPEKGGDFGRFKVKTN